MTISVVIKLIEIIQYKLNSMRLIEEPVTLKTITSHHRAKGNPTIPPYP